MKRREGGKIILKNEQLIFIIGLLFIAILSLNAISASEIGTDSIEIGDFDNSYLNTNDNEMYLEDSNKIINSLCDREEYEKAIQKVSTLGEEIIDAVNAKFKPFIEHASNLNFDIDDDYLVAWHKSQEDVLRQRLEETYDLAQLGISVEIIDHELNNYYRRINYSMSKLKKKCLTDPSTHDDYLQLKTNFQYLESNYKMLQPMYRSARRMKTEINGDEIYNDMKLFFQIQLADANIVFEEDDSFRDYQVFGLKSIFSSVYCRKG